MIGCKVVDGGDGDNDTGKTRGEEEKEEELTNFEGPSQRVKTIKSRNFKLHARENGVRGRRVRVG